MALFQLSVHQQIKKLWVPSLPGTALGNETMSADGSKLYITSYPGSVLVISTKTNSVINTIPADDPSDIAISADGSKLWVVTSYSGIVTIINTATNTYNKCNNRRLKPFSNYL